MPESKQETSSLESTSFDFDSLHSLSVLRPAASCLPIQEQRFRPSPVCRDCKRVALSGDVIITSSRLQCNRKSGLFSLLPYFCKGMEKSARKRTDFSKKKTFSIQNAGSPGHLHGGLQRDLHHVGEGGLAVGGGQFFAGYQIVGDGADGQRPLAGIGGVAVQSGRFHFHRHNAHLLIAHIPVRRRRRTCRQE